MVADGKINRGAGKKVLTAVIEKDVDPEEFARENSLDANTDESAVAAVVDKVLAADPKSVEDYKNGKTKVFQALFGACMRELRGTADPMVIKKLLEEKLK